MPHVHKQYPLFISGDIHYMSLKKIFPSLYCLFKIFFTLYTLFSLSSLFTLASILNVKSFTQVSGNSWLSVFMWICIGQGLLMSGLLQIWFGRAIELESLQLLSHLLLGLSIFSGFLQYPIWEYMSSLQNSGSQEGKLGQRGLLNLVSVRCLTPDLSCSWCLQVQNLSHSEFLNGTSVSSSPLEELEVCSKSKKLNKLKNQ